MRNIKIEIKNAIKKHNSALDRNKKRINEMAKLKIRKKYREVKKWKR